MIVTALLSFGMSGEVFHGPLLDAHPGFRMKSILERKSEKSRANYPYVQIARTADDIAADPEVELVVVNTPNNTHFDFAKSMLEAGKHVLVEKPFTNTHAEALELIRIAKSNNRILTVFQNRRWDGDFLTVKKVIAEGLLGDLVEYEAHFDRYRPYIESHTWKELEVPGSGLIYNLGSHMIDQVMVLFGMPKTVHSDVRIQRKNGKVVDNYEIIMDYGLLKATVKSSYLVREQGPRYILHGREGSFIKNGMDPQEQALKDGIKPGSQLWGVEDENDWGMVNTQINGLHFRGKIETIPGNYLAYYDNLYDAIRDGGELAVKPEEAALVIKMIEEAQKNKPGSHL